MEISFWKAHEILCDERNDININQLFLEWLEKLWQTVLFKHFSKLCDFWPFKMFCGINFISGKGRHDPFQQMCSDFFSLLWD